MTKAQKKKFYSTLIVIIALCISTAVTTMMKSANDSATHQVSSDALPLKVYYIDVGQGDSELIQLPSGENILIDSGEKEYSDTLIDELDNIGCKKLDYVVVTHPHTDHMGGMKNVISGFDTGEIWMPRATANTKSYKALLSEIKNQGLMVNTAKAGKIIYQSDDVIVELLSPLRDEYEDLNNYSAVIKLTYGSSTFLFTGDAEKEVENDMLESSYSKLDCDVLKVGHHGSRYSSSKDFISAVTPDYAVIECGADNSYGHPHTQALDRLKNADVEIYRTDLDGTVCITTTGNRDYDIRTEK